MKALWIVLCGLFLCGCVFESKVPVYLPAGSVAELAKDYKVNVWVINAQTGKRELRTLAAPKGWWVVRPTESDAAEMQTPTKN